MAIGKPTRKALGDLALQMVREPDTSMAGAFVEGFRQGKIPARLREAAGGHEVLVLTGDDLRLYGSAVHRLSSEAELEHLATKDVDEEVWEFVCELFVHRTKYSKPGARQTAIQNLLRKLARPWINYEVMAVIENVHLTVRQLRTLGVEFVRLTGSRARQWGLADLRAFKTNFSEVLGKTVAIAQEEAGSPDRAAERAVEHIDDALNALRIGIAGSIMVAMQDEQMLFRRGTFMAVKESQSNEVVSLQWHRDFRPIGFEIRAPTAKRVRKYLLALNALSESPSRRLSSQLRRALHWVGISRTRENHDDKVVDLCTALETLLSSRSDRRKGEAITVRYMLLSTAMEGGFTNPFELLDLYNLRSKIVHGSDVRVTTRRDYSQLHWIATSVLKYYVNFVTSNSLTSPAQAIEALETHEALAQTATWLILAGVSPEDDLIRFILERLKRIHKLQD